MIIVYLFIAWVIFMFLKPIIGPLLRKAADAAMYAAVTRHVDNENRKCHEYYQAIYDEEEEQREKEMAFTKSAVSTWIGFLNMVKEKSGYNFMKDHTITSYEVDPDDIKDVTLVRDDGREISGVITLNENGAVEYFRFDEELIKEIPYASIKRDVEDLADNELYAYINAEIAESLPYEGTEGIIFDCAKGLGIPREEFLEKYDTPEYNRAFDEVLKEVMDKCGVIIKRFEAGKYYLMAQDLSAQQAVETVF